MAHSHMPVEHLIDLVESRRSQRERRGVRPEWLTRFIDDVADLFEPLGDVGRVGFDCSFAEELWIVGLYLGSTESVGGADDGRVEQTDFQFDLRQLYDRFAQVDRFCFTARPSTARDEAPSPATVTVEGLFEEHRLRLDIHTVPPAEVGPGFRAFPNGRLETV